MLWKKESKRPDALYVDMFASCKTYLEDEFRRIHREKAAPLPQKNDKIALESRNRGNGLFGGNHWIYAMEWYNESLRFAKPGSEHISLAYANRSTCFLKLNMYDKCLKDIELAKAAGYPAHLMHKLEKRKAECLKRLEEGEKSHTIGGKLSFEADKNFPCMANVLKVQKDNDGNLIVVAKQDIDVDQTIVVEDAFSPYPVKRYGMMCNICLKRCENFVPCDKCAMAIFCPNCEGHFLHKYECGLSFCGQGSYNNDVMAEVRTILLTIKIFATADELMEFVERIRNEPKTMPTNLTDDQTKYGAFFNLRATKKSSKMPHFFPLMVYPVYQTVLRVPEIKAMFKSRKHLRFLQHLMGHHTLIKPSVAGFRSAVQPVPPSPTDETPLVFANLHLLMGKYFEHSCYPNVLTILANGQNTIVTTRPIKKGEKLFESRIPLDIAKTGERRNEVLRMTGKNCACPRCRGIEATAAERQQLSSEPLYKSITLKALSSVFKNIDMNPICRSGNYVCVRVESSSDNLVANKEVIDDCVTLLQKYGHIGWCKEIDFVMTKYQGELYKHLVGTIH